MSGLALVLVVVWAPAALTGQAPGEYDLKAAFLLNFLRFVEWPAGRQPAADAAFEVAILGDDPFGGALDRAVAGQQVNGRAIRVRRAARAADLLEAHLVFVAGSERARIGAHLRQFEGRGILITGDTPGFAESGVMLNLFIADQRVRFEANTAAASRAGLKLSSQLLRIARIVG